MMASSHWASARAREGRVVSSHHVACIPGALAGRHPHLAEVVRVVAPVGRLDLGHLLRLLLNRLLAFPGAHGVMAHMDPLGHAPLDALEDGAGLVQGLALQLHSR